MAEQWVVEFTGRAGGQARAVFSSKQQATSFVERHAGAVTSSHFQFNWSDTTDLADVTTPVGHYHLSRIADDQPA